MSDDNQFTLSLPGQARIVSVNVHNKTPEEMENYYVLTLGGDVYELNGDDFAGLLGWLNDYPGRVQIEGEDILSTSSKGEKGVTMAPKPTS